MQHRKWWLKFRAIYRHLPQVIYNPFEQHRRKQLATAKDEAFKSDAVMAFQKDVDIMWKKIQIWFFNGLANLVANTKKEIDTIRLIFMNVSDFIKVIPQIFSAVMKGIIADFRQLASIASALGVVLKNVFTFNVAGLSSSIDSLLSQVKNFKSETVVSIKTIGTINEGIKTKNFNYIKQANAASAAAQKAENEAAAKAKKDAEAAQKAEANRLKGDSKSPKVKALKKEKDTTEKDLADAAKRAIEIAKDKADQASDIAKNELANYIAVNAAKLNDDKRLTAEKLADQIKYYEDVKALKEKELASNLEKELIGKTESEAQIVRQEYATKALELETELAEAKAKTNKQYATQTAEDEKLTRAIDFEQKLIDLEEQGASEYELRQVQLEEQKANDLAKLEEDRANELISLQNYEAQKKLIEAGFAQESKQIIKDVDQYKLESRAQVIGGLANLFGRESVLGKIFAAAEIVNTTAMQAGKAFAQAAVFASNPLTAPLAINANIQGGIIIASGAAQLAKLVAPKAKAADGMLIGNSHANGGIPIGTPGGMIEAEGGEVIINRKSSAMYRGLLSDINTAGGGVRFANGGILNSRLASVQSGFKKGGAVSISNEAIAEIANAIYSGSQAGFGDLAENRKIQNNASF